MSGYYYVHEGAITPPPPQTIWARGRDWRRQPFPRPQAVGAVRVAPAMDDDALAALGVYALVVSADAQPGELYVRVEGTPTVSGLRVTRHDTWRAMSDAEAAEAQAEAALAAFLADLRAVVTRLRDIEDNVIGANLAQTQAAVRDLARALRHMIRYTAREALQ